MAIRLDQRDALSAPAPVDGDVRMRAKLIRHVGYDLAAGISAGGEEP